MANGDTVQVKVVVDGEDDQERNELATKLRRELLRLDVDAVERPTAGEAPAGTRAIGPAEIGALLVTFTKGATALASLVAAVRSWLAARGAGTVKLQLGADTIEVTGRLSEEQRALVEGWIRAHERG